MESKYGINCNSDEKKAFLDGASEKMRAVVDDGKKRRNEKREELSARLHELGQKEVNGQLSEEEKKVCQVWHNLNEAINELGIIFRNGYGEDKHHFTEKEQGACYRFLCALDAFDETYLQ